MKFLLLGLVAWVLEFPTMTVAAPVWIGPTSGTNPCPWLCSTYGFRAVQKASVRVCQGGTYPGWILTYNSGWTFGNSEQTNCWSASTWSARKDSRFQCLCDDPSPKLFWRTRSSGTCSQTCNGYPQKDLNGKNSICYATDNQRMGWYYNSRCYHSNLANVQVSRSSTSFECLCKPVPPTPRPTPPTPQPTRPPAVPTPQPTRWTRPTPRPTQPVGSSPTKTPPEKCKTVCAKSNSASVSLKFLGQEIGLCRSKPGNFPGLISTLGSINCVYIDLQASRPGITQDFQCMCLPFSVQKKWSDPPTFDCSSACTPPLVPVTTGNNYVCNATVGWKTRFVGFNKKGTNTCVFPKTKSTQDKKAIASCLCVKFSSGLSGSGGSGASMTSAWKNMDGTSAGSNTGNTNSGNTGSGGSGGSNTGNVSPKKLPSGTVAITVVLFVLLCCTGMAAVYFYFVKKDTPANYEAVQMS